MHGKPLETTWREKLPPICPGCGYNLTGLESRRCPECGRHIIWSELRTNAKTAYHALRQVEDVNDMLGAGVGLGIAALALILVFFWINWGEGLARVVGFFLAMGALGAGLQVFRVRRFPEWAAEYLPDRPNYFKAVAIVMLALLTMVLAIFLPSR
jgi:predicted RNA-binding Zn-ribbon protein involved in translation (DUF1610 family)